MRGSLAKAIALVIAMVAFVISASAQTDERKIQGITVGPGPTQLVVFPVPSETAHNFQTSIGFSFRF